MAQWAVNPACGGGSLRDTKNYIQRSRNPHRNDAELLTGKKPGREPIGSRPKKFFLKALISLRFMPIKDIKQARNPPKKPGREPIRQAQILKRTIEYFGK